MGVGALWGSGHRGPVPVPVLVGVPILTRPNTAQMREEAGRYQRRSAVVQEWRPKPRRAAMGDAKAQTQVPTPADTNATTSKKQNYQSRGPTQRRNSPGQGPERVGKAFDAKHAGKGHQGA